MQNGLHVPMSSHEFSRVKIPAPSESDLRRRSELWAHTVIMYQRYAENASEGLLPRVVLMQLTGCACSRDCYLEP